MLLTDDVCLLLQFEIFKKEMNVVTHDRRTCAKLRVKDSLKNIIGWCLEKLGAPAKLKMFEFVDPASNETVYLYTSKSYSVLCVGDRRFYFDRITGNFDGISTPAGVVPRGIEFRD
jgi:hypothetical protein